MNANEQQIVSLLRMGAARYGFMAVKAEFEAEGTRTDELVRLCDLTRRAGLALALKLGGCEAARDCFDARNFGAEYVIAPMIESSYALAKYLSTISRVYPRPEVRPRVLYNLETMNGLRELEQMGLLLSASSHRADGIVFGRVDFAGSIGCPREEIDGPQITAHILNVSRFCRERDLELVVGGGVCTESEASLRSINTVRLDRFETRKIVLSSSLLQTGDYRAALECALRVELLWLANKRDHYQALAGEDAGRLEMLTKRATAAGGL